MAGLLSRIGVNVPLRQPHGFEGFNWLLVNNPPHGFVAAKGPHPANVVVHLYIATPAAASDVDEYDHFATRPHEKLLGFEAKVFKRSFEFLQCAAKGIRPAEHACGVDDGRSLVEFEIRGEVIRHYLACPVERFERCP